MVQDNRFRPGFRSCLFTSGGPHSTSRCGVSWTHAPPLTRRDGPVDVCAVKGNRCAVISVDTCMFHIYRPES